MKETIIEVKDLKKYFYARRGASHVITAVAADGISFSIEDGETLGLVGESGCGKTTVGRILMQLYTPDSGEILYRGRSISDKTVSKELAKRSAMVFQDPYSSLDPRMTVEDIIGEPLDIHRLYRTRAERRDKILGLLSTVGLNQEHAARYPHEFSGGQRQRIGIARALATSPEFIVCDEPTSALDVSVRAQIINTFIDLRDANGPALLFISHDLSIVRHISHRIAVMYLGKIVEIGDSAEVCDNPLHPYTAALMSAVSVPDPERARSRRRIILDSDSEAGTYGSFACRFFDRCPYREDICKSLVPELNEISCGHRAACHFAGGIDFKI